MIRIGKCLYGKGGQTFPTYEGFESIIVMSSNKKYNSLSPFMLKDENGVIMENLWQFSKIYKSIPNTSITKSKYDHSVIWSYKAEDHIDKNGNILKEYWKWRQAGMKCPHPIRYPIGAANKSKCLYSIPNNDLNAKLEYIEARIKIYIPLYIDLVKKERINFPELKAKLKAGQNLLLIDPDGPHQESLDYYMKTYGVNNSFIENNTICATSSNLTIMAFDPKHPFGHAYCLALALLDKENLLEIWSTII